MADAPDLLPRLAAFARLLHDAGIDAGPGRLATATRALGEIELRDQLAFRDSLRACFVSRKEELPLFEAAFERVVDPPEQLAVVLVLVEQTLALGEGRRVVRVVALLLILPHRRGDLGGPLPQPGVRGLPLLQEDGLEVLDLIGGQRLVRTHQESDATSG